MDPVSRVGIPLRVYMDDAREPPVVVEVPPSAFELRDGRPVGLVGPRVRIDVANEIDIAMSTLPGLRILGPYAGLILADSVHQRSRVQPNAPDRNGGFIGDGVDLAQNTAFYAAYQTITLAERGAGREIRWGTDGQLAVQPHAFVGSSGLELNAFFLHGEQRVRLGAMGTVRNGVPVPLDGSGFAFIERAAERQREAMLALERRGATPAELAEGRRRGEALEAVIAAARRDDLAAVEELVNAEVARVTPPEATGASLLDRITGAVAGAYQTMQDLSAMPEETRARLYYMGDLERLRDDMRKVRPLPGRLVQLANDRFVASHESGHAVLATLMPALLETHAGATLHEAYGDTVSILTALDSDDVIRRMVRETGGDLTRSNFVSRIGEEFAITKRDATRDTDDDHIDALRDAANHMRVADFKGLTPDREQPVSGERDSGHHAVSQVVSGALYEQLARRANAGMAAGTDSVAAVRAAGDEVSTILHRSMLFLPENGGTLHDVGAALMQSARTFATPEATAQLEMVLRERGLLGESAPRIMGNVPEVKLPELDAALRDDGALRAVSWARRADARVLERVTDDRGWTRVRYGVPQRDARPTVLGSFVFDPHGRLVAMSAAR